MADNIFTTATIAIGIFVFCIITIIAACVYVLDKKRKPEILQKLFRAESSICIVEDLEEVAISDPIISELSDNPAPPPYEPLL